MSTSDPKNAQGASSATSARSIEEILRELIDAANIGDAGVIDANMAELDAVGTVEARAASALGRGVAERSAGNYGAAQDCGRTALSLYEELGDRRGMARAHNGIANVARLIGNHAESLLHYHQALELFTLIDDRSGVANVTANIGNVHTRTGDFAEGLQQYHRALAYYEELGERDGIARVTSNIGLIHQNTGNYPDALAQYHAALAIHRSINDRRGEATVLGNIGLVFDSTSNHAAAVEHYLQALQVHEEIGDRSGVARVISNLGSSQINTENFDKALVHLERARALFEELGEPDAIASALAALMSVHLAIGNDEKTRALLAQVDAMVITDPRVAANRELRRAELQARANELEQALLTLQSVLAYTQERGMRSHEAEARFALRDLALKRNDLAGYVEHNNEYTRITEEITGRDATTRLAMQESQRRLDAERKEHEKQLAVLHSTLPKEVAERVARGEVVNDHYENASVIFLDIVGFTDLSSSMSSQEVITLLDDIFTQCDAICAKYNVTKIKTIGDSYMCVSFDSVINAALCAVDMSRIQYTIQNTEFNSSMLQYRIGIHCGPVTAGVIGKERMQYDVWGDTVNVASRMESSGTPGRIHVSQAFADNLKRNTEYTIQNSMSESDNQESHEVSLVASHSSLLTPHLSLVTIERGSMDIKGKGSMSTSWLEGATT
jgi:adenylate cyclase